MEIQRHKTALLALLLMVCMQVFAQGDQLFTLRFNGETLQQTLVSLEHSTPYKFVFSYKDVEGYRVRGEVKKKNFDYVMHYILQEKPLAYTVKGKIVTIKRSKTMMKAIAAPQPKTAAATKAEGTVYFADDKSPVVGAQVRLEGTDVATVTDIDGHYSLPVKDGASRVHITYIGMAPIDVAARPGVRVFLESESKTLQDVVVTGYQTLSKERVTGSFAKVTADDMKSKRFSSLSEILKGEIAGFDTQTGFVRGVTSMNGITQPLYVIDGLPVENTRYDDWGGLSEGVPDLNIDDIESVTVLKDAAAASIYGARAANGVVVIVTKKAKQKRTSVSGSVSLTWHPYSFRKEQYADAADVISLEREWASENPYLQDEGAQAYAQSLLDNNVYPSEGIRSILNYYAGNTTQQQMESTLTDLASRGYRFYDDIEKYASRTALYQQYHLNVGRASDSNNLMVSLTYRRNRMNDKYSNDNQWGVDIKDMLDITSWLHLQVGNYTSVKKAQTQMNNPLSIAYRYEPYTTLKENGENRTFHQTDWLSQNDQDIIASNGLYSLDVNPLDELSMNLNHTNNFLNRTYGKLGIDLPWGFKYDVMFQYEYGHDKSKQLYNKESYYVRSLVDQYATNDGYGTKFNVPYGNILFRGNQTSKAYTFRQQLNYSNTFGGVHNIVALAGHEVRKTTLDYGNTTLYNYDTEMLSYSLVDQSVLNTTYGLLGGYGLMANNFAYDRYNDNRYVSYYANAAYTYDDRYMFSASIRWDRSNLWGTSSKYQHKPIWSLGAGWNIDREKWFNVSWVNRLKFRASYGIAGNVAKDAAPYMTAYYNNNYNVGGTYGTIGNRPNPNLRWEKTTTTNIGFDFALFGNRLNGSIDYYNKKGTDLLANTMGVPTEGFGYSTYKINNGKMRNRGFEVTLSGDIIQKQDFALNAMLTYSYNKNKVLYVNVEAPVYYLQLDYAQAYPVVGNPFNALYAFRWAGLSEDGLPQVYDAEGNAVTYNPSDVNALVYAGTTVPTSMASLNLSARYKDFELSCQWMFQGGHKMRDTSLGMLGTGWNNALYAYVSSLSPVDKRIANRWTPTNTQTDIPRAVFAESFLFSQDSYDIYRYADCNIISATNLQLTNISLAYNVPQTWLRPIHLSAARLQFNVENVCTIAKNKQAKYLLGGYTKPNYVLGIFFDI